MAENFASDPATPPEALRLEIDRDALAGNWRALDRLSGTAAAGAAVKADAYGLGTRHVVPVLREAGCRDFFVAHWSEAAELARLSPPEAISVLHGPLQKQDAAFARALGVRPVINSVSQARHWLEAGGGPCDVMIDTGINRLGVPLADLGDEALARLEIDVLMSHLASADEDSPLNERQRQRWGEAARKVRHRRASLANSAGIALGATYHGDLTRPGLALYGGVPRPELAQHIRQVARLRAAVLQCRRIEAGETVGYNATFTAPRAMRVGVVALGYADGYLRAWSEKGTMRWQGQPLPVLGRVSMDMSVIDLSAASGIGEGDWVNIDYSLLAAAAKTNSLAVRATYAAGAEVRALLLIFCCAAKLVLHRITAQW